ncbi:MAG: heme o synthase [Anaerolineales bacterium]|nr:heme o synthase [Anaerolineales bacterium]
MTTHNSTSVEKPINERSARWKETLHLIVVLYKLRVVSLLLMAATGGAFLAAGGWPGWQTILLTWVTGGMAAAGASSINQYWERHSDGKMGRTKKRPLVNGEIVNPAWVPYVGAVLISLPSLAVFPFNPALTTFLLLGAFIYVFIYTIWLKPRTLLNIVIGGAAGSAAVLSGSAAAGQWNHPGALVLSLLLFLWTPFHFWSLAILYRDDYARTDVPMLPVHTTPRQAAWWVMSHTIPTSIGGLLIVVLPELGWLYFIPVFLITVDLVWRNIKLVRDPSPAHARSLFMSSNFYLLVLILAICFGTMAAAAAS